MDFIASTWWRKRGGSGRRRKLVPTAISYVGHSSGTETTGIQFPVCRLAKADTQVLQFLGLRKPRLERPKAQVSPHSRCRDGPRSPEAEVGLDTGFLTASMNTLPVRLWDKTQEGTSCWQKQGLRCPESQVTASKTGQSWFSRNG